MDDSERAKLFKSKPKKQLKNKIKKRTRIKFLILLIFLFLLLLIIIIIIVYFNKKDKIKTKENNNIINLKNIILEVVNNNSNIYNISHISTFNDTYQFEDYQKYFNYSKMGKILYEKNLIYSDNPKISVIIGLYNAEKYINSTLISIENQKMKDIEIVIVDDCSTDNSVKYVEEAQKKDPRIILYKNKKNMGCLYTKSLAALKTRGKYIFLIDNDDQIIIDDLFETLYEEIEKSNIDIIEYSWINSNEFNIKEKDFIQKPYCTHKINKIILQPELRRRFCRGENRMYQPQDRYIWGRIIKREIYIKALKIIGEEDLKRRIIIHDDTIITFMLFKIANSFIKIGKIGLVHFNYDESSSSDKRKFNTIQNYNNTCFSYINYIELLFKHAENDTLSRQEVFFAFNKWNIKSKCKNYEFTKEISNKLAKNIYNDPYINQADKLKIKIAYNNIIL